MNRDSVRAALRQPASAAVAGLVFGVILTTVILLMHNATPSDGVFSESWLDDPSRRQAIATSLNLIPFAGIAFLWFMAVIRTLLGSREDRFFETVFMGSGLIFVALLFVCAASLKGVLVLLDTGADPSTDTIAFAWSFGSAAIGTFGLRMAAVFTISVATMGQRIGTVPRWLALIGYAVGLVLLLTPPFTRTFQLLFPAWVVLVSLFILIARRAPMEARH